FDSIGQRLQYSKRSGTVRPIPVLQKTGYFSFGKRGVHGGHQADTQYNRDQDYFLYKQPNIHLSFIYYGEHFAVVMIRRDHRLALNLRWAFVHSVFRSFLVVTAGIADQHIHLPLFIFPPGYPKHIVAFVPEGYPSTTFVAVAVSPYGLGKPNPVFKPECFIGKGSHRTDVDHISRKIIVNGLFHVGADLRHMAPAHDAVYALVGQLIGHIHAAIAKDTAIHVQLDLIADIDPFKSPPVKLI